MSAAAERDGTGRTRIKEGARGYGRRGARSAMNDEQTFRIVLVVGSLILFPIAASVALCVLANSLTTANWFLFLTGGLAFVLIIVRTRTEEEKLVARFGDSYRAYIVRTGRFLPRIAPQMTCALGCGLAMTRELAVWRIVMAVSTVGSVWSGAAAEVQDLARAEAESLMRSGKRGPPEIVAARG